MRRNPISNIKPKIATIETSRVQPFEQPSNPHYNTPEHRAWSDAVIARAGGCCEWPGCGRSGVRLFADHRVEITDGGPKLSMANGWALCGQHHSIKTAQARKQRLAAQVTQTPI